MISAWDRPQTDALRSPRIDADEGGRYRDTLHVDSGATSGSDWVFLTSPQVEGEVRETFLNTMSRRDGHCGERADRRLIGALSAPGAPSSPARSVAREC